MTSLTDQKTRLTLDDVSVIYPDGQSTVTALDRVSLQARAGEMTAIVGESGSGKSSLLSVAAALLVPDSGTVSVAGVPLDGVPEAERARVRREHIGIIFQQANLIGSLTARDQLLLTDHIRGLRGKALRERAGRVSELLERVGLGGLGDRRMHQLSGGQRQRVNIARALMGSPGLLLADEPTSALDATRSRGIVELLRELTEETGAACVMVTHDRSLLDVFDAVTEVRDGRVL